MSEIADRYRNVAGAFAARVRAVPAGAWDAPSPCEGWVARDIVRHLVEWVPALLEAGARIQLPRGPSVDDDPVAAWTTMSDGIQRVLDDPAEAARTFSHDVAGTHRLDEAIGSFVLGDVLVHTWDLARATGLDERLDEAEVREMLAGAEPLDEVLRASGHYGPRVTAADGADDQAKLLAFLGRVP